MEAINTVVQSKEAEAIALQLSKVMKDVDYFFKRGYVYKGRDGDMMLWDITDKTVDSPRR